MCTRLSQLTLNVGLNSGRGDRLGQGNDSSLKQPAEEDSGSLDVVLLGNLLNNSVLSEVGSLGSTKRGVGAGEDVVLLQPSNELGLRALDGELDLV